MAEVGLGLVSFRFVCVVWGLIGGKVVCVMRAACAHMNVDVGRLCARNLNGTFLSNKKPAKKTRKDPTRNPKDFGKQKPTKNRKTFRENQKNNARATQGSYDMLEKQLDCTALCARVLLMRRWHM